MLHQLRHVVVVVLVVFVLETPSVAGRLMWGECTGLRLENALSIPAKDCISLGGKCCDLGQMMIENDLNNLDERYRKCRTCYNPDIKVKCTGKLLISKSYETFTAEKCIAARGKCCNGFFQNKFQRYNVRDAPSDAWCSECFSGTVTGNGSGCSGKLLATTKQIEPKFCSSIGGRCCDGSMNGVEDGSAFCPLRNFDPEVWKKCNLCYSGPPKIVP